MNKEKREKLSAFVDGEVELSQDELKQLANNDELKSCWANYHLIRESMTQQVHMPASDDWFQSFQARLDDEPVILAPSASTQSRSQKIYKQVAGFAVAATVAGVAIVSLQNNQIETGMQPVALAKTAPAIHNTKPNASIARVSTQIANTPLNNKAASKLSSYLVTHYEYSMTNKMQGMIPYMRIVSETPAVSVKKERQGK